MTRTTSIPPALLLSILLGGGLEAQEPWQDPEAAGSFRYRVRLVSFDGRERSPEEISRQVW
jgi:hypothetical protein